MMMIVAAVLVTWYGASRLSSALDTLQTQQSYCARIDARVAANLR